MTASPPLEFDCIASPTAAYSINTTPATITARHGAELFMR
jgi:hypothetical protein